MSSIDHAVDKIFEGYDKDNSGTLDTTEAAAFVKDLFSHMGKDINSEGAKYAVQLIDDNSDGHITKDELKELLKSV